MTENTQPELQGLVGEDDVETPRATGALSGEVVERIPVGRFTADVTIHRRERRPGAPALWIACAQVQTDVGVLQWCGAATEQEVAAALVRRARQRGASAGFDLGQVFRDFGRTLEQGAQSLARSRVLQRVVGDIRRTLDSSALSPVLQAVQFVPGLGQAVQGFRAATTLVDDVLQGDRGSRQRLVQIRQQARRGDPTARQAMQVVEDVVQAQRRMARARARGAAPSRRASAAQERAWREAEARVAELRATRSRRPASAEREPLIPPAPSAAE